MTVNRQLTTEFVRKIPEVLEERVLYISIEFATAVHKCCCGCGQEVVTPLSPTDWQLIFDGVTASLEPSIGNWSFPCQSHYWITRNRIEWAPKWSRKQIREGREYDIARKHKYRGRSSEVTLDENFHLSTDASAPPGVSLWQRFKKWFF